MSEKKKVSTSKSAWTQTAHEKKKGRKCEEYNHQQAQQKINICNIFWGEMKGMHKIKKNKNQTNEKYL